MILDLQQDKRRFHRIFYHADALLSDGAQSWPCIIIDLSLKGCLLRFDSHWQEKPEQLYVLSWPLTDAVEISMTLKLAHINPQQPGYKEAGFQCEYIDIDSISQLRRLVELNLGDCTLLERDLLALSAVHE